MKHWFKTKNDQIINLDNCEYFWMENAQVFCKERDYTTRQFAQFATIQEAKDYLDLIFRTLVGKDA